MHPFEPRRVDEDLEHRLGLGQPRHFGRIELDRQERSRRTFRIPTKVIGTRGGQDRRQQLAERTILAQVVHALECGQQRRFDLACRGIVGVRRIESRLEQLHELARKLRMLRQRRLDEGLRQDEPDLAQVTRIDTQHHDVFDRHATEHHQAIEIVVVESTGIHRGKCRLEHVAQRLERPVARRTDRQTEVVQPDRLALLRGDKRVDPIRPLVDDAHAEALEHRQRVGQRHRLARHGELEAQRATGPVERPVQCHA